MNESHYIYFINNSENIDYTKVGSTKNYEIRWFNYKTYAPKFWKYIKIYKINNVIQ